MGDDLRRLASKDDPCQRGREPVIREDGSIEIPLTQGQVALVDMACTPILDARGSTASAGLSQKP